MRSKKRSRQSKTMNKPTAKGAQPTLSLVAAVACLALDNAWDVRPQSFP